MLAFSKMPFMVITAVPAILNVPNAANVVVETILIAPVMVNVFAPVITAFPTPVVDVVMEVNDRAAFIVSVPPSSITIVLPAGIAAAFMLVPVNIVV